MPTPVATSLVSVVLDDRQAISVDKERLVAIAERTANAEGATGEISLSLIGAAQMAELNRIHTGEDEPTDVLSFPIDGLVSIESSEAGADGLSGQEAPPVIVGEVLVCVEVAAAQAKLTLENELDLLVAHGVLHLLGYDHHTQAEAETMAARELSLVGRSGATWLSDEAKKS